MVNQGTILGRVGKMECKNLSNGTKVCNLSMVTSKKYIQNNEKKEKTTWHNVTMYSKLAEIAEQYVNVGDMLYVQGEMDSQKYTDKSGVEKVRFYVIAHELSLLPKSKELKPATANPANSSNQAPKDADPFYDDDVPF